MFKNVLRKTLYEKRWTVILWSIGVIAMAMLMMSFYHSFSQGGFDEVLKNVPKSFQGLIGDIASLKTVPGYVSQEVFALRIPLLTLIMGIILFSGLLAGDEADGTLQTLLAQPVSRLKLFIQKYLAGLVISFIICAMSIIGVVVGLFLIHEHMSIVRLFQSAVGVWLLTVLFGTVGFALGAITGKKGMAGSFAGLFTFGTYLITSFVNNVAWLKTIEKISPFHYYNSPAIAQYGLRASNVLIMAGSTLILLLISLVVFLKRDIYQR